MSMFEKNLGALEIFKKDLTNVVLPKGSNYKIPSPSLKIFNGEFIDYVSRKEIVVSFCADSVYSNPQGTLQGGLITACFDDAFGPLGMVGSRHPILTIDINVQFVRAIKLEEKFFIKAKVVSLAHTTMYMEAEAFSVRGKLLAKASSNILIVK